jgi:hypothetical protein
MSASQLDHDEKPYARRRLSRNSSSPAGRASLFARILRAIALQDVSHDTPRNLLDVVDRRTL